jgi:hypothetical protein
MAIRQQLNKTSAAWVRSPRIGLLAVPAENDVEKDPPHDQRHKDDNAAFGKGDEAKERGCYSCPKHSVFQQSLLVLGHAPATDLLCSSIGPMNSDWRKQAAHDDGGHNEA